VIGSDERHTHDPLDTEYVPSLPPPIPRHRKLDFALPTINVIFLLMLYFLLAGTIAHRNELQVVPPETSHFPVDRLPRPLLLISDDGSFALDGQPLKSTDLVSAARTALEADQIAAPELNILAPADMPATRFLSVLATFNAAGVPVRVVTLDKSAAQASTSP
jgi:biopolymer transport protein ExbD